MGKRSQFPRRERDFYPTPEAAVGPLIDHIDDVCVFDEPCAGAGDLTRHLVSRGLSVGRQSDVEPSGAGVECIDAIDLVDCAGDVFITNPPWSRHLMHPILNHLISIAPTWCLIDADWAHTKQAAAYMERCEKIVSVGRLRWIAGSPHTGKDNCCWYLFSERKSSTVFHGQCVKGAFNRKEISWPRAQPECVPPRSGTQFVPDSKIESNPVTLGS